jgi:transposase
MEGEELNRFARAELAELVLVQQGAIAALEAVVAELRARVKELEDRLARDSHNSGKPPSSDGLKKRTRSLRQASGKKPGGQPGHPGHRLEPVEAPDRVVVHAPSACGSCGRSLGDGVVAGVERRQVFDLPPLKLEVVEHRAEGKACPGCGAMTWGAFPAGVSEPARYGPGVKGLGVYLKAYQLVPYGRASALIADLFGGGPSEGTLTAAMADCAGGLEATEAAIKGALGRAALLHCDETGLRVAGRLHWLHVTATGTLTHYARDPKRGKEALDRVGILPGFAGRAVHDGWAAYRAYACAHALCNAHHLRELTFLAEQHGQAWAAQMKGLLVEIKGAVEAAETDGREALTPAALAEFEARYRALLAEGYAANPPPPPPPAGTRGRPKQGKARNLLDRLRGRMGEVLAFAHDFRVPFDNNLAERDLRMMKVQQKVSGCFRDPAGADQFCRVRGYISTARKQGHNALTAIQHVFLGSPLALATHEAE